MSFAAPAFAWALLALVPLAAVYFIRTRPRRQPVNAFFLWEKVFEQRAASSLFQRLRNLFSLLILLLAFLAAVFALMKPRFGADETPDLLIVVDRSVSMRGGEGGSRLEAAKDKVDGWISALGGSQRAALATADTKLEYKVHLTGNARPLRDALEAVGPSDLPLRAGVMRELSLLSSVAGDDGGRVRILFVTDGRSAAGEVPEGVERVVVGEDDAPNAGITAADLHWVNRDEARLFVSVWSGFPEDREAELELVGAGDGALARLFTMNLVAGEVSSESIPVEGVGPGSWMLRLKVEDDLAADNEAALGLNAPQSVPVEVASPNPYFFQQVVAAFARADSLFEPVEDFGQLGLAEGGAPDTELGVVFKPSGESPFWSDAGDELAPGAPEVVLEDHPLIARTDPALWSFEGARSLEAPEGAVVVLRHAGGAPLLYTASADGRKVVVVNLDPLRGDFFLSPWFPVLVHDATALLMGRGDRFPSAVATGGSVEVPGTGEVEEAVRLSDGGREAVARESPAAIARAGNYEFSRSDTRWRLGGAVFSPGESGPSTVSGGGAAVAEPAAGWPAPVWLLLAALGAVLIEEALYQRRKVG